MYAEAAMVNSRLCEQGLKTKEVEWKKMGGWDVYHTLGFEIQLCEFETTLCEFETTLCGLE